jgi:hypothetical protein
MRPVDRQSVLVDVIAMNVMEVPIMKVLEVFFMPDGLLSCRATRHRAGGQPWWNHCGEG